MTGIVGDESVGYFQPMVIKDSFIAVYMMSDRYHGTIYIGVTSQFLSRIVQHREGDYPGFTRKYGLKRLVWYEPRESMIGAIQREKSLKRWPREWKINLIERDNPHWDDLYPAIAEWVPGPRLV